MEGVVGVSSSPDVEPASVINDGSKGRIEPPNDFRWDLVDAGLGELFGVNQKMLETLAGTVILGVRLLSPNTGAPLCESFSAFEIGAQ